MPTQLTFNFSFNDDTTFANFYAVDNQALLNSLQEMLAGEGESYVYLWGNVGTGRSHLLQACCHAVHYSNTAYIPLAQCHKFSPEILDGMEAKSLLCIDDIDAIMGKRNWEEAFFHCFNRLQQNGTWLVVTANCGPKQLDCGLPDLASRLASGIVYEVKPLTDRQKLAALQLRAKSRGMNLPVEVAAFILHHCPRDSVFLFNQLLEKLDKASLAVQRKLTIPFVRKILEQSF